MKLKLGFISNSSSTAFMITNTSNVKKSLVDFVIENMQLLEQFKDEYDYHDDPSLTEVKLLESAAAENYDFEPGEQKRCVFGDEDGTLIGKVYDYILRDGGVSKNFEWHFYEWLR